VADTALSVTGEYNEPTNHVIFQGSGYVPAPGMETVQLEEALLAGRDVWRFDAAAQKWMAWLALPFLSSADLPRSLAPGEAIFFNSPSAATLEVPEFAFRIRYYHQDHLGSSTLITDSAGELIEESTYLPFGGRRHSFRPRQLEEPYGFTQKEQDVETGLHYFEARFLFSRVGRFASPDALYAEPQQLPTEKFALLLANPQKFNLYAYARNNPLIFTDPTGYDSWIANLFGLGPKVPSPTPFVKEGLKEVEAAQKQAALLAPGGKRTIISGHGRYVSPLDFAMERGIVIESTDPLPGYTAVPKGTSVTFYSKHGQAISDKLGNAIELGKVNEFQYRETYGPGELIPNYRLYPPKDLTVKQGDNPVLTVQGPTSLSTLLKPDMGPVDIAACRADRNVAALPPARDVNDILKK
jgi:RHS repeat-associated protein